MKFRTALFAGVLFTIVLMAAFTFFLFYGFHVRSMDRELLRREASFARMVPRQVAAEMRHGDVDAVNREIRMIARDLIQVAYIFLVDPAGQILAHTFEGTFPKDLSNVLLRKEKGVGASRLVSFQGLRIRDFAVPVSETLSGVLHVGMNETFFRREMGRSVRGALIALLFGLVLGSITVLVLSHYLVRPLAGMQGMLERFGKGDLSARMIPARWKEWSRIAEGFNRMADALQEKMEGERRALQRADYLNAVLSAIRNVNQLITREKDRDRLIHGVCEQLVAGRGYGHAWVVLIDETERFQYFAQAGLTEGVDVLVGRLERGEWPECVKEAMKRGEMVVRVDIRRRCSTCPLSSSYGDWAGAAVRLEHGGRVYGCLMVAVPSEFSSAEEQSLLGEVAGDVAFALHDLEVQREAEELRARIEQSEALLSSIYTAAPVGMGVVEGRVIRHVNDRFCEMTGYFRQELMGQSARILYPSDEEYHRVGGEKYAQIKARGWGAMETCFKRKDGRVIDVLLSSASLDPSDPKGRVVFTVMDLSDRKRMEAELDRIGEAVVHVADLIVMTDVDGAIQYVNPAFEKTTGYSKEEVLGENPRILKSGKQNEAFYRKLWDTITQGKTWTGRFVNRKKDGSLYSEEAVISPVFSDSGEITGYVAVKRDVTERLKLEERLRHAQRMEAIGTLAGGIAHDFNNILFPIIGYAEMSLELLDEAHKVRGNLTEILRAAERAQDLVKQILTFSRQGEQERKPVQIRLLVKETVKLLHATLPRTIDIRLEMGDEPYVVSADPTQIHQVLMNLCTNAYHAMEETGGVLTVSLERRRIQAGDFPEKPDLLPGDYLKLSVQDTGKGMDSKTLERIFDPYFTTKPNGKGTGLGLSVVHGIVTAHNGHITVYSEPGKGSSFHVYLPCLETPVAAREVSPSPPPPTGTEHILLVDDEPQLVEMERQMLEGLGYRVTARTSPLEALAVFQDHPGAFDLVITDMTMPGLRGDQLTRRLLEIRPDIPVLLCTGFSELISEDKTGEVGIRALLMKPILRDELARVIRDVLDA